MSEEQIYNFEKEDCDGASSIEITKEKGILKGLIGWDESGGEHGGGAWVSHEELENLRQALNESAESCWRCQNKEKIKEKDLDYQYTAMKLVNMDDGDKQGWYIAQSDNDEMAEDLLLYLKADFCPSCGRKLK